MVKILIANDCVLVDEKQNKEDEKCKYDISNKNIVYFFDFEELFKSSMISQELKVKNTQHCDAIIVEDSRIGIYELSMYKGRDINTYLNKFEYCMCFLEYFSNKVSKIDMRGVNIDLVIVANPKEVATLDRAVRTFKNSVKHFRRPIIARYSPNLVVKQCQ
ncbi:hypothetical protein [Stygiolobus caldivivus]|uniref:Uncharacterized protein n=1 Tax=Stygiolobus caldivivus TaxID=2824673 RepID=A0A8D5ZHV0_9CREN|nr:hypothetical protein [Stygiolobus caldivivus]BCU68732.1 hypothetical protein KN1_00290 [Stygiolobus caldivivus]